MWMSKVVWDKISESESGDYASYYARINKGFLIRNLEKKQDKTMNETIQFFNIEQKNAFEFEFDEM